MAQETSKLLILPHGSSLYKVNLFVPIKPNLSASYTVQSDSYPNLSYIVDTKNQTCTCENFQKRVAFPKNSLSRLCKHLLSAMWREIAHQELDTFLKEIIAFLPNGPRLVYIFSSPDTSDMYLSLGESDEWINIYARSKTSKDQGMKASGDFQRFGWSVAQRRWSHARSMTGSSIVKKMLSQINDFDDLEKFVNADSDIAKVHIEREVIETRKSEERLKRIEILQKSMMPYLDIFYFCAISDQKVCKNDLIVCRELFEAFKFDLSCLDLEDVRSLLTLGRKNSRKYDIGGHGHRGRFRKALESLKESPTETKDFIKQSVLRFTRRGGSSHHQLRIEWEVGKILGRDGLPPSPFPD